MDEKDRFDEIAYERGSQPALVESFEIEGLYGYRTISLSSQYAATILIAKNGSGKTTLLGALDAFLRAQLGRLKDLEFNTIRCKLRGSEELVLSKEEVVAYTALPSEPSFRAMAASQDLDPALLHSYLIEDYQENLREQTLPIRNHQVLERLYIGMNYNRKAIFDYLEKAASVGVVQSPNIETIFRTLRTRLDGFEIVYLPTYRRVELPMEQGEVKSRGKKPFRIASSGLFSGDIQFGLSDISEHLASLNQTILFESNQGYREISANIINELIDGTFERETPATYQIPDKEELELFFSRLKEGKRSFNSRDISVPNIDKIYTGEGIPDASNRFLIYFLSKLNRVIQATRYIEVRVEDFVTSCNRYLRSPDRSTSLPEKGKHSVKKFSDDKELRLNRRNLSVHVESLSGKRKIKLDALSSGEKQMISLFAKLVLYPKDKLVLIDEPELSLSLEWQQQILVDVVRAPLCRQVIAITHSPFVFDNSLEPFARSLKLSINPDALPAQDDDVEADIQ
ncbi:AAA domain-containing protein, putative AbiEii toxin, Type IV TA system [Rhizobium sp. NFR07]|uniref:AAA family ATPase n=1 Tax=Rhizobium sp. NFR07 TaxID=1566262 RepID=UPI0008F3EBAA|nr:AAA family ATPase [Rhizobium sp. NFR07]SFB48145.1 AAA domain-containing protein, putative AbiEii toxin, Type IV TA system [Rhizobium sp. NFR07]